MNRTLDLTKGNIWKKLLLFCFPIMLGTLFQQLYNAVDVIVVGRFCGADAIAAVGGSSGMIINLAVSFFVGISSGVTVVISRLYGVILSCPVSWAFTAVETCVCYAIKMKKFDKFTDC